MDEITISRAAVDEAMGLISEYITQGGAGFNDELLSDVFWAFCNADTVIVRDDETV